MSLSDRIRAALPKGSGLSQSGLAKACGISRASVNAWANGKTDSIDGKFLTTAASYLGVSAHWLSTGEGPMLPGAGEHAVAIHTSLTPAPAPGMPAPTLAQALGVVMDAIAMSPARAELKQLLPMLVDTNAAAYRARLAELLAQPGMAPVPAAESKDFQPPVPPPIFDKTKQHS